MCYVQGKNDPLSNMWPVKLHWDKYTFSSSEHIYVYKLLKWHGQLNTQTLQMLLNCPTGFYAKKLGKRLIPQQSISWSKKCVSKMYSILQSKWYQSKAFVQALLDASGDILHTLPNGHRDSLWAYPGANKHGYLLKQLHNSKVRKCVSSQNSNGNSVSKVTNFKFRDCTSSLIPNQSSSMVNSNGKITDSASSLTQIRDKKQYGGNSDEAQVYTLRTEVTSKYSNAEIIQLLQNPDENKMSYVMPIKPKGGEVYILD